MTDVFREMTASLSSATAPTQAQWVFGIGAQCFATLMALTGIFGVYKLQILKAAVDRDSRFAAKKYRHLIGCLELASIDVNGEELEGDPDLLDVVSALNSWTPKLRETAQGKCVATDAREWITAAFKVEVPFNEFAAASNRLRYSLEATALTRKLISASLIATGAMTAASLILLLLTPTLVARQGVQGVVVATTLFALSEFVMLVLTVCLCVAILQAGQRTLAPHLNSATDPVAFKPTESIERELAETRRLAEERGYRANQGADGVKS
jgi:hypothetical protein